MAVSSVSNLGGPENVHVPSPKLARSAINEIASSEETGVPLNTPWTFYLDKYILHYLVFFCVVYILFLVFGPQIQSNTVKVSVKCDSEGWGVCIQKMKRVVTAVCTLTCHDTCQAKDKLLSLTLGSKI